MARTGSLSGTASRPDTLCGFGSGRGLTHIRHIHVRVNNPPIKVEYDASRHGALKLASTYGKHYLGARAKAPRPGLIRAIVPTSLAPAYLSPHPIRDADDRQRGQTDSGNRTWCGDNGAGKKAGSIKDTMPNAAKPVTFQTLMVANLPQKHATKDNGPNFYQ
jgi:hypothetical protein